MSFVIVFLIKVGENAVFLVLYRIIRKYVFKIEMFKSSFTESTYMSVHVIDMHNHVTRVHRFQLS